MEINEHQWIKITRIFLFPHMWGLSTVTLLMKTRRMWSSFYNTKTSRYSCKVKICVHVLRFVTTDNSLEKCLLNNIMERGEHARSIKFNNKEMKMLSICQNENHNTWMHLHLWNKLFKRKLRVSKIPTEIVLTIHFMPRHLVY